MILLKVAGIYSLTYQRWKKNRIIYSFVLYDSPGNPKVHALNLGARSLNSIHRAKLVNIIARLSKVEAAKKWDGATLYRIFKTYLPQEIALCYRIYIKAFITHAALINYGFNSPDSFTDIDLAQNNKALFQAAGRDLFIKLMNLYTGRAVKMQAVESTLATIKPAINQPVVPDNVIETTEVNPDIDNAEIKGYY